jgi:gas vesicle protein
VTTSISTSWSVVLIGTLTGVIVSSISILLAQHYENRRWNEQQISLARQARADRLRESYARMAQAAVSLKMIQKQKGFHRTEESLEERDSRHLRDIRDAINHVSAVGGLILIEPSATNVRDAYSDVVYLVDQFLIGERGLESGQARRDHLDDLASKIDEATDRVLDLARAQLDELYAPPKVSIFKRRGCGART